MSARAEHSLRIAIVGATATWHGQRLARVCAERGHDVAVVPATRLVSSVGERVTIDGPDGATLHDADLVFVRGVPRGSLEQVVYRLDALHVLDALGVRVLNPATAIERTVDKLLASALLRCAGLPTPRTVACERGEEALHAFDRLGGDVVVKPLFGAMGLGITRIDDRDVAHRVFRALELERAVYYVQETIDGPGRRDLRVFVLGGEVVAAIERRSSSWRANVARGARATATELTGEQERISVAAAEALGADYAGVDLLVGGDGAATVVEVNGIPGWQALEQATGIDVATRLVAYAEREVVAA